MAQNFFLNSFEVQTASNSQYFIHLIYNNSQTSWSSLPILAILCEQKSQNIKSLHHFVMCFNFLVIRKTIRELIKWFWTDTLILSLWNGALQNNCYFDLIVTRLLSNRTRRKSSPQKWVHCTQFRRFVR